MSERQPQPCLGIMGWIFGHKYVHGLVYVRYSNTCYRCGMMRPGL